MTGYFFLGITLIIVIILTLANISEPKSNPNSMGLIHILEGKEIENICSVYRFLDGNKIEHQGNFIQPIKNSLTLLTYEVKKSIKDPSNYELTRINYETVCRVLDAQFKDSAAEFRPNLLTLQQVLDTTPTKRSDTNYAQGFNEIVQKSRIAVKNWLDTNQ